MSNRTKATGAGRRHIPQHRKDPSWTVADLAAVPGGLGTKIVVAGMAGATLAIPATSVLASPSSLPPRPGSGVLAFSHLTGQGTALRTHTGFAPGPKTHPDGQVRRHHRVSEPADSASRGPGLLLEPGGTFVTLAQSSSNVHTVPAGSLIITSDGTMMRPLAGTYSTIYGLVTVAQPAGSGTQPAVGAPPATATPSPTTPATATPLPRPTAAVAAPVAAPATAQPAVQIVSAMGGVTVADNGTVTPTGNVNLAFPGSGIGGSLPLSLPSAAPAEPAQPAFPAADPNAALADPIFQGLAQSLGRPAPASQPEPIMADAGPLPVQLAQTQAPAPSLSPGSLTVILPDGTPQSFPLGSSSSPVAPPMFGQGSEILVPLGTQVPLPGGGSTTMDSPTTLTLPDRSLPAIHAVPAMPTSDNSPANSTAVAMNTVDAPTGAPVAGDAGGSIAGSGVSTAQPPADVAQPPADPAQPPADVAPPPADPAQPPAPATTVSSGGFTSSDPTTASDPMVVASFGGSDFGSSFG